MKITRLLKSKKAVNDMSILWGIISIFILMGVLLPYINNEFSGTFTNNPDLEGLEDDLGNKSENVGQLSIWTILFSVFKMFFWYGGLPFYIEAVFLTMRIMLLLIIARNVWIGGGA